MTGSSALDYEMSVGFTSTHTESTSTVNEFTLSYEMSEEIKFGFVTESATLASSYRLEVQNDVENSYSYSIEEKISFSCPAPEDPSDGVGLWQWIVKSSDGKSMTYTRHWLCRYGEGRYNVSPQCPWNACKDGNCYEC